MNSLVMLMIIVYRASIVNNVIYDVAYDPLNESVL